MLLNRCVYVPGRPLEVTETNLFGGTHMEASPFQVNGPDLAQRVEAACLQLNVEGFRVISMTPETSGATRGFRGEEVGWSLTTGMYLFAERTG